MRALSLPSHLAKVTAISNELLVERWRREQVAFDLKGESLKGLKTTLRTQGGTGIQTRRN